jgi:hypothetical protein
VVEEIAGQRKDAVMQNASAIGSGVRKGRFGAVY